MVQLLEEGFLLLESVAQLRGQRVADPEFAPDERDEQEAKRACQNTMRTVAPSRLSRAMNPPRPDAHGRAGATVDAS